MIRKVLSTVILLLVTAAAFAGCGSKKTAEADAWKPINKDLQISSDSLYVKKVDNLPTTGLMI